MYITEQIMKKLYLGFAAVTCLMSCSLKEQMPDDTVSSDRIQVSIETVAPCADVQSKITLSGEELVWTGNETLDVLIANTESTDVVKTKSSTLSIDPDTYLFSGMVDLGGFSESDIRGITVPGNTGAWIKYSNEAFEPQIPLNMNQVQEKEGVMNGDNFPLYAPVTDEILAACRQDDGSYRFKGIQLEWACSAIRFNVYGTHESMDSDEVLKSVSVSMDKTITVSLTEGVTIAGKDTENGAKLFMAISPDYRAIHSITVTTDKAAYLFENPSGVLKNITDEELRGNIYQFGLNLEKFERLTTPVADLLDVKFNSDGTAEDLSESQMSVSYLAGETHVNYYNSVLGHNVAHFSNPFNARMKTGFYMIDYTDNTEFLDKIADGHTLEALFRVDANADGNYEIRPFSSSERGGTGFVLTKPNDRGGDIAFAPNVTTTSTGTFVWTESGIVPEPGVYYHVVGIWNKEESKTYIYVNGELKATQNTTGEFKHAVSDRTWFCIGGDPYNKTEANCGFKGDIAIARIYDTPLNETQVKLLWDEVKAVQDSDAESISVSEVEMLPAATVKPGCTMYIYGKGFKEGDIVTIGTLTCETIIAEDCIKVIIPDELTSGQYEVSLVRGGSSVVLASEVALTVSSDLFPVVMPQIVAHRGYHPNNVAENSLQSLTMAQELAVYGSEFDVYVTTDDVVVLHHNPVLSNHLRLDSSTYDEIKDYKLQNNEKIPTLEQYLEQAKKCPDVKLLCEIKPHETLDKSLRAVEACVEAVRKYEMEDQVEWISFDYNVCLKLVDIYPDGMISYLGSNIAPSAILADGIRGVDYTYESLTDEWIIEAHELGMPVNVWTINKSDEILKYISKGVEFITTDESELALKLISRPYVSE